MYTSGLKHGRLSLLQFRISYNRNTETIFGNAVKPFQETYGTFFDDIYTYIGVQHEHLKQVLPFLVWKVFTA
jgi:hypothetical protein